LAELEAQIVAEMLQELDQLEAFESAALEAAVAEREALVAAAAAAAGGCRRLPRRARCILFAGYRGASVQSSGHHVHDCVCGLFLSAGMSPAPPSIRTAQHSCSPHTAPAGASPESPAAAGPHPRPPPPAAQQLLCPVCMGAFLLQRAGVVVCPRGCLQLNLAAESLSLGDLRARLEQVYEVRRGFHHPLCTSMRVCTHTHMRARACAHINTRTCAPTCPPPTPRTRCSIVSTPCCGAGAAHRQPTNLSRPRTPRALAATCDACRGPPPRPCPACLKQPACARPPTCRSTERRAAEGRSCFGWRTCSGAAASRAAAPRAAHITESWHDVT
jgi:hypothetical protein